MRAAGVCAVAAAIAFVLLMEAGPFIGGGGPGTPDPLWSLPDGLRGLCLIVFLAGTPLAVISLLVGLKLRGSRKPGPNIALWLACGALTLLFFAMVG